MCTRQFSNQIMLVVNIIVGIIKDCAVRMIYELFLDLNNILFALWHTGTKKQVKD